MSSIFRSSNIKNFSLRAFPVLLTVYLSTSGCSQTQPAPTNVTPEQAVVNAPPSSQSIDIPANIKPEDVAQYTLEKLKKQRENALQSQSIPFSRIMQIGGGNGDYRNMIIAARKRSLEFPQDAEAPYYLGIALFYDGDFQGAKAAWKKAKTLDPKLQKQIAPLEARLQRILSSYPNLKIGSIQEVKSDFKAETEKNWNRARALIEAKKYDEIELVAKQLQNQPSDLIGLSPLGDFLDGLCSAVNHAPASATFTDSEKEASLARLKEWQKARPDSMLCRTAIISSETSWAWSIRGGDYANKVSEKQWEQVHEHLNNAGQIIQALPQSALKSLITCLEVLRWGHLSGLPEAKMREMWADYEKRFPESIDLALEWSLYWLPQWSGNPGEWQRFATTWANQQTGNAGDIRYAQFLLYHQLRFPPGEMWAKNPALWPRARRGFLALLKKYPDSISLATATMQAAVDMKDSKTAQDVLINHVKNRMNSNIFDSPRVFAVLRIDILDPQKK